MNSRIKPYTKTLMPRLRLYTRTTSYHIHFLKQINQLRITDHEKLIAVLAVIVIAIVGFAALARRNLKRPRIN